MYNYVISLTSADQRREHIKQEFAQKEVDFQFFDAITPVAALSLAKEMHLNYSEMYLTQSELACFMSHVSLWKKIVDENIPYMAIFEDDIYLGENAQKLLNHSDWIQTDWHIIKLEAFAERTFLSSNYVSIADGTRKVYQLLGQNYGTAGYILSLVGAKVLLAQIKDAIHLPLDHFMFEKLVLQRSFAIHQVNPTLCIQDMMLYHRKEQSKSSLPSMLGESRGDRMSRAKKTGLQKIKQELQRICMQLKMFLFSQKIYFK